MSRGDFEIEGGNSFVLEINPWVPESHVTAALFYRGAIVSAWGYIDTTLTELCIRSARMPEYRDIQKTFPSGLVKRLKYMRTVLQSPGPFATFEQPGLRFLARFEAEAPLRHLMAHGHMRVLPDWGATFTDFRADGRAIANRRKRFTLDQLRRLARKSTKLSRHVQRGRDAIEAAGFLPQMVFD